ncbi:MAG: extracellular solute-binding protein [Firmicutes bacterium]|nr:extracellular solute-binding protein [Bacillota bacterium]
MTIKKKFLIFVTICLIAVSGTGCDTEKSIPAGSTGNDTLQDTSVVISYAFWDEALQPIYRKLADEFEKANPNVKIKLEITVWDEYWPKLEAAAAGGTYPDVFWMNGPNIIRYAEADILMPIDDRVTKDNVDMTNYPQSLVKLYTVAGEKYAMPLFWDTAALWYNKEIFDDAGIPYPDNTWDFEKLKEVAGQLTDKSKDIYGIAAKMHNQGAYYNTILQAGGFIISEDRKTSGFDKPETIEGIRVWLDLINEGLSPTFQQMTDVKPDELFQTGRIAMIYGGVWMYPVFSRDKYLKDKLGIVVMPKLKQRGAVLHGVGCAISSETKNPDEAWAFVKFLSSKKANDIFAKSGAGLSAYLSSVDLFMLEEMKKGFNVQVFTEQMEYATMYPCSKYTLKWQAEEKKYLEKAWAGEMSVEEACRKIAEKMNKILAAE